MKRPVLLVDGTNLVMRFAHAMVPNSVGNFESPEVDRHRGLVMQGVHRAIVECARGLGTVYAIVAFDSRDGTPSWRRTLFPGYKASRTISTAPWSDACNRYLVDRGVLTCDAPGFEADDVIATLVRRLREAQLRSVVFSSDSDLLQLAAPDCHIWQFGRGSEPRYVRRSEEWICEKYKIASVDEIVKYKAIVGEPGDDLPGVDGFGPVKARQFLRGTLGWTAVEQRERYELMRLLVALHTEAPVPAFNLTWCRLQEAS